tara:strand:+ start:629 stop:2551 length:1923 start_codon:yes stop_codon:yes gene_type:complete
MTIKIKNFLNALLIRKSLNYDLLEESRDVEGYDNLNALLNKLSESNSFKKLLNPVDFEDIQNSKQDLIKNIVTGFEITDTSLIETAYKFLDELEEQAEILYKKNNINNSDINENYQSEAVIGIDLGTTYSVAAYFEVGINSNGKGKGITIPAPDGQRLFPSVVSINENGDYEVGSIAKRKKQADPLNTFYSTKRFLGRNSKEISEKLKGKYTYKIIEEGEKIKLKAPKKSEPIECEEISANILSFIKNTAQKYLNKKIKKCVITVPAYFDDNQRQATKVAADIAGLEVLRIINEPTAAAYAYGCEKDEKNKNILVADLGGGTFDISLINFQSPELSSVISTAGDCDLGGDDFTESIFNIIKKSIYEKHSNFDLNSITKSLIISESEKVKCELSEAESSKVYFPLLNTIDGKIFSHEIELTRVEFEKEINDHLTKIKKLVENFLKEKKVLNKKINKLVLAGGSSRIPSYRKLLKQVINIEPNLDTNPDEVVACGASLCAEYSTGNNPVATLIDVCPMSLGIEVEGDEYAIVVEKNTNLPTEKTQNFTTVEDYQNAIHFLVFQGEDETASKNTLIGKFLLEDIEIAKKEEPLIAVTFRIDLDGILSVSAKDLITNSFKSITIKNSLMIPYEKINTLKRKFKE